MNSLLTEQSNNTLHYSFQTVNKTSKSKFISCSLCQLAKYQLNVNGIYPAILVTVRFEGIQLHPFFPYVLYKALPKYVFLLSSRKTSTNCWRSCATAFDTNVNFLIRPSTTFSPCSQLSQGAKGVGSCSESL